MELQAWYTGLQRRIASAGFRGVLRFARRNPLVSLWGVVAALLILMAIAAPILAPQDPLKKVDTQKMTAPPDGDNLFGTDLIGRDILRGWSMGSVFPCLWRSRRCRWVRR